MRNTHRSTAKALPFENLPIEELPFWARGYAKGLRKYSAEAEIIIKITKNLEILGPLEKWIEQINLSVNHAKKIIQESIDSGDNSRIADLLKEEAESLENLLDSATYRRSRRVTSETEALWEDIDEVIERLAGLVSSGGYDLYHYLIGADF